MSVGRDEAGVLARSKEATLGRTGTKEIVVKPFMLTAFVVLFSGIAVAQEPVLVLEGGTLIDGTGRAPVEDALVIVTGNRITTVARQGQVEVPAGATVIQTDGQTILPGLVDTHVHLRDWHYPMYLAYGVTTMADTHNDTPWSIAQRALLKSGLMQGPRLFVSGARVTGPLGQLVTNAAGEIVEDPGYVEDAEEARAYVRYLNAIGVDHVKIDLTITDAQLAAVLDESRKLGLRVFGHTRNIKTAVDLGMRHMEHMNTMARALLEQEGRLATLPEGTAVEAAVNPDLFPPLIEYMALQGVSIDPTLYFWMRPEQWRYAREVVEPIANDPGLAFVPTEVKERWVQGRDTPRQGYDNVVEFLTQYAKAGGKILVSSDAHMRANGPGFTMHIEMQMMTDMGIPAMKAIQGATLWGAEALGREQDYGSVEVGKVADFVIVEGDPLADIAVTRNIQMVIMDGEVVDTTYDPNWSNPLPRFTTAMEP
jgi:imidazolonepropionase-like amidohydrolase